MRIIKEGQIPQEIEHEAICKNCQTEFGYFLSEICIHQNPTRYTIDCPLCKKNVHLDLESWITGSLYPIGSDIFDSSSIGVNTGLGEKVLNYPAVPTLGGFGYEAGRPFNEEKEDDAN